ncbi:MAG: glycosyltransferase family 4 protein [Bacteroidota bacterium]|nr:glycosyltransferase family 4 protein [Bacteroidota bacterium]
MTINFILPFAGNKPIGGFKIIYEYANRLSERGHKINLIHPSYTFKESVFNNSKYFASYYFRKLNKSYLPDWFELNKNVNVMWVRSIEDKYIPDADILITSAWRTAKCSSVLDQDKGKKFYFIQHYETWNGPEDEVNETWKLAYRKIVISKWLKEIAESMGESAEYIPNGLDFREFGLDINPNGRNANKVMMLYNELKFKGCESGIEAIIELKKKNKDIQAILFGVPDRPEKLPGWMEYYKSPDRELLRKLYNDAAIFISPSLTEGFGLTSAEAMMCGAALAASFTGGHKEFAIEGETALTFEPGNVKQIIEKVSTLINDKNLRVKLAMNGNLFIQKFTWEKAVNSFEKVLKETA